jgi:L-rhamnose mutarotase
MYKAAFAMELKPGRYDEYVERHRAVWPEIEAMMTERGVSMVIHPLGDHLVVFVTAPTEEAWKGMDGFEIMHRWDAFMAEVLVADSDGVIVMRDLPEAYSFGAFRTD